VSKSWEWTKHKIASLTTYGYTVHPRWMDDKTPIPNMATPKTSSHIVARSTNHPIQRTRKTWPHPHRLYGFPKTPTMENIPTSQKTRIGGKLSKHHWHGHLKNTPKPKDVMSPTVLSPKPVSTTQSAPTNVLNLVHPTKKTFINNVIKQNRKIKTTFETKKKNAAGVMDVCLFLYFFFLYFSACSITLCNTTCW
jgi:hypothetical protein